MEKFKMKSARNGFILENSEGDIVFQSDTDNEQSDVDRFIDFLYEIIDNYGPEQSRYGHKLRVVWIPGDKNDTGWEELKKCPICYQEIKPEECN